jgi:hypothetical protein
MVNTGFAILLGIGLFLIGIPNAFLWAVLTLVLRFLPYVGLWISAFFPLALSIAISAGWKEPLLTLVCRASAFRGNGAGSAAHCFVGAGAWSTEQFDKGRALSFQG